MANEIDFQFLEHFPEAAPMTAKQLRMKASELLGSFIQDREIPADTRIELALRILKEVPLPED